MLSMSQLWDLELLQSTAEIYKGADKSLGDPNEKTPERSPHFVRHGGHCCRGDLLGWTTF